MVVGGRGRGSQGITLGKSPALIPRVKGSHARGPSGSGSHVAESKFLPRAPECCSSSVKCGPQDCLMFCLLNPKERGSARSSKAVLTGQLPDNPQLCLGATVARVELTCLRTRPRGAQSVSVLVSEAGTPSSGAPGNAGRGFSVPTFSNPLPLFFLGMRPASNPWRLLPAWGPLPHPGGPSLPGPCHPGDSAAQMESRVQRWAAGGTGDQGECVEAGDGTGVRRGAWARSLFQVCRTPCSPPWNSKG